jgi:hypothetical protein
MLFQKNDIILICASKFHDRQDQTLFLNQGKIAPIILPLSISLIQASIYVSNAVLQE